MNKFPTPPPDRRTQKGLFPPQDENRKYTNQTNIPQISMKKQIGSYLNNHGPHYSYYSNYTSSDFCDNEDLHNNNLNILYNPFCIILYACILPVPFFKTR